MYFNKKVNETNFNFKKLIKIISLVSIYIFVISIIFISSLHFYLDNSLKNRIFNKIDFYFSPLEIKYYSFENLKRLIKNKFTKVDNRDILFLNSNFENTSFYFQQIDNKDLRSSNNNFEFSKGKLLWENEKVKIKFRPKGDRKIHFNKKKPSFRIKVQDGKTILNGLKEFSIQSPLIRNYISELIWYELLKLEGIIVPDFFFKKLYLNGEDLGIYNIEEVPTTFMLERLNKRNSSILKFDETFTDEIINNPEIRVINSEDVDFYNQQYGYKKLKYFIENGKVNGVFDLEKLSKFFAISDILQIRHGLLSKSFRFYLDPISNLLEPIPFDGHYFGNKFGDRDIHLSFENNNDPLYYENNWLKKFFNKYNGEFQELYFKNLKYYLSESFLDKIKSDKEFIWKLNKNLDLIYNEISLEDRKVGPGPFPYLFSPMIYLEENLNLIKNSISKKNLQVFFDINKNSISIYDFNKFHTPIVLDKIITKNFSHEIGKKIFINRDESFLFSIQLDSLKDSIKNDIIENKKLELLINNNILKKVNFYKFEENISQNFNYKKRSEIFYDKNDTIYLKNKIDTLKTNLIIDKGKTLFIESGQTLILDGSELIINGDFVSEGTKNEKVTFTCTKNGGLILKKDGNSRINFTDFEEFYPILPKKSTISSSITFYNDVVEINNSSFNKNNSEDFLNVVSSQIYGKSIFFENCFSDCFDSDYSSGKLNEVMILNSGNDGVDFSYSSFEVNHFSASSVKDKAISIGENSKINFITVKLFDSEIGVVIKDESETYIDTLVTNYVKVPLASFIKKPRFKYPNVHIEKMESNHFEFNYLIQKGADVFVNDQIIKGKIDDVEKYFYGNVYGKKSSK